MASIRELSYKIFKDYVDPIAKFFEDEKEDLRRSGLGYSLNEYVSMAIMVSFMVFLGSLPILAIALTFLFETFLFGFVFAITVSMALAAFTFFIIMNNPKLVIQAKEKDIDNTLPFASLYLSTLAGSKIPLHKTFSLFSGFTTKGELAKQINEINEDIKFFGLDINSALEKAISRSPSKKWKELLYGILSTIKSGSNLDLYLKEKSKSLMQDYRRSIFEFSRSLTVYIEVYLTAIVLGAIFFTILTAIVSGIGGTTAGSAQTIIPLQFFLIFVFMPAVTMVFITLIRSAAPGGE